MLTNLYALIKRLKKIQRGEPNTKTQIYQY